MPTGTTVETQAATLSPTLYGWSLGLRARSAADASERVAQGISTAAVERLRSRLGLSPEEAARAVGTSPRTLARRRKAGRLDPDESDRLYRLARLYEHAVEVFGGGPEGEDDARRWFKTPQWALGDRTPLVFSRTEPGAREVDALLDRIDHGVLA